MTDINTWNATDDNNNVAAPAGWPEGMMPTGVNNSARAMMGSLKRWRDQSQPTVTATGTGNAQIITYPVAPAALANGDTFAFFALANTGPATLTINAQAAKPIVTSIGTALIGGEIPAGAAIAVVYDGASFRMLAAPTPLSVANGGTGATTPGTAADAIGAVKDTGDTMTGNLTVPNITYSGHAFGGAVAFGWDGSNTHVYINGSDVGAIGDITSVAAGNGLTGGGSAGALTLAMSGFYTGNFTANGLYGDAVHSNGAISAAGAVSGTYFAGGASGAGTLQGYGASNQVDFRWEGAELHWGIDKSIEHGIVEGDNAWALNYASGGGPVGIALHGIDTSNTVFVINTDGYSDQRIKLNIAPTQIDALKILQQVPVSRFDIEARAAAILQTVGKSEEARQAALQNAMPVPVAIGLVAQDVQRHIPEAVNVVMQPEDSPLPGDMHTIIQQNFVPYLVRAIQQLAARVEQLETALVR
jgi:hypothetical protein